MKQYKWRLKGFSKGIKEDEAIVELERIEELYGILTPENVLSESIKSESLFHPIFNWDDEAAAHNFRLQQARTLMNNIEVIVITDGQQRSIPVFEVVNSSLGRTYKNVEYFSSDDVKQVRDRTLRELSVLKNKLSAYKTFEKAVVKLAEVQNVLQED